MRKVFEILKNNKGQGVMEYMIITSLVGIVCLVAVKNFGGKVQKYMDNSSKYIEKQITLRNVE